MAWTPTDEDLAFGRELIEMTKQGGIWASPDGECIYTFDHANSTLVEKVASPFEDFRDKTKIVFEALGWVVKPSSAKSLPGLPEIKGNPEWN